MINARCNEHTERRVDDYSVERTGQEEELVIRDDSVVMLSIDLLVSDGGKILSHLLFLTLIGMCNFQQDVQQALFEWSHMLCNQ